MRRTREPSVASRPSTAVAEYLIGELLHVFNELKNLSEIFSFTIKNLLDKWNLELNKLGNQLLKSTQTTVHIQKDRLLMVVPHLINESRHSLEKYNKSLNKSNFQLSKLSEILLLSSKYDINEYQEKISGSIRNFVQKNTYLIDTLNERVNAFDPKKVLQKGYSITLKNSKPIKTNNQVSSGDEIETLLFKGSIKSTIK